MRKLFKSEGIVWKIAAACFVAVGALAGAIHSYANQANTWSPTVGQISGLTLTTNYNNAFSAIQSCNSGGTAPVNDQTLASVTGQCWLNTSTTPFTLEQFDGSQWLTIGWLDTTNHQWIANNAGGTGTIASAATTDLGTIQNPVVAVTGTVTITSFGSTAMAGATKFINFTGALTLTNNAVSLILPNGGSNITTAAGDTAIAVALGAGNWRVVSYTRAAGLAANSILASMLATSSVPFGTPCLNCTLRGTVAANALTIAVKTLAGSDPSSSDPAYFLVPDPNNGYSVIIQSAAISVTVPSSATLGTVSNQATRIWVGVFNNGGSAVLAVYVSLDSTNLTVVPWDETSQVGTTAISGTATSPQVWYSASSITGSKSFRTIGAVEATEATAGTWATSPSKVYNMGPGVKRPGDVVQEVQKLISTADSTTSATYAALTNNRISFTPVSAPNLVRVESSAALQISYGANSVQGNAQLSRGTTNATNMIGNQSFIEASTTVSAAFSSGCSALTAAYDIPQTATTYTLQAKISNGSTFFVGGNSIMSAREIQI